MAGFLLRANVSLNCSEVSLWDLGGLPELNFISGMTGRCREERHWCLCSGRFRDAVLLFLCFCEGYHVKKKKKGEKVGEMDQWLRALAALSEDLSSTPSAYKSVCNSSFKSSNGLSMPLWATGTHVGHRHTFRQKRCRNEIK